MTNQLLDKEPDNLPVPDGQERLATQAERDDVNKKLEDTLPLPGDTATTQKSEM